MRNTEKQNYTSCSYPNVVKKQRNVQTKQHTNTMQLNDIILMYSLINVNPKYHLSAECNFMSRNNQKRIDLSTRIQTTLLQKL